MSHTIVFMPTTYAPKHAVLPGTLPALAWIACWDPQPSADPRERSSGIRPARVPLPAEELRVVWQTSASWGACPAAAKDLLQ